MKRLSLILIVLTLAGCLPTPGTPQPPTPTPQPTPTRLPPTPVPQAPTVPMPVEASALQSIRERGRMRVGVLYNYPPFGFLEEDGELAGYEVALMRRIAELWDVEVEFVQVTRQTRLPMLFEGQVDVLAAAMPHTRDLEQLVEFSATTFRSGFVILAPEGSPIAAPADLSGQTVAVVEGEAAEALEDNAQRLGVGVETFPDPQAALDAMLEQDGIVAVVGRREAMMLLASGADGVDIVNAFIEVQPYAFAVRRGDTPLRDLLDLTLQEIAAEGEYGEIFRNNIYGYAADIFPVLPGEADATIGNFPAEIPAEESTLARMQRGEGIRVAGLALTEDPPLFDGQPIVDGYNRALINEMARRWSVPVTEVPDSAEEAGLDLLLSGEVDLVVGVRPDLSYIGQAAFTQPYYQRALRLIHMDGVVVFGVGDLNFRRVMIVEPEDVARDLVEDNSAGSDIRTEATLEDAFEVFTARAVDALVGDEYVAALMLQADEDVEMVDQRYRPVDYAMAVRATDADLRALVNFTLQDMALDGTLQRLAQQYFAPYRPEDEELEVFEPEIWPGSGDWAIP